MLYLPVAIRKKKHNHTFVNRTSVKIIDHRTKLLIRLQRFFFFKKKK
jgi:hypothetical protein